MTLSMDDWRWAGNRYRCICRRFDKSCNCLMNESVNRYSCKFYSVLVILFSVCGLRSIAFWAFVIVNYVKILNYICILQTNIIIVIIVK